MSQLMIKYSKKHLGKSISSTMIYKSLIQDISYLYQTAIENEDIEDIKKYKEELKKIAKSRGHSMSIQQSIYFKI